MQQTKITKTLGGFKKFLENDNKTGLCREDTLRFFDIQRIFDMLGKQVQEENISRYLLEIFCK